MLSEYVDRVRPLYACGNAPMLWPTERRGRVSVDDVNVRFREYRDALGLPREPHPHCLRHAYVTHLIEDGFDPFFVQRQVGHAWGSTTALYTGVSSDYKNRALAAAPAGLTEQPHPTHGTGHGAGHGARHEAHDDGRADAHEVATSSPIARSPLQISERIAAGATDFPGSCCPAAGAAARDALCRQLAGGQRCAGE